jgi:hypothetical protein
MIILIAFKKHQAPSDKLQTAGGGKGRASGNWKPETCFNDHLEHLAEERLGPLRTET